MRYEAVVRGLEARSEKVLPIQFFYIKDPYAHREMIEGWKAGTGREAALVPSSKPFRLQDLRQPEVAEKIEIQTRYTAELSNMDVR